MEASPIIFYLSSDDDEATPAWEDPKGDEYNRLSEVLEAVDNVFHDPDDLTVVGEVNPTKKSKSPNSVVRKVADEDDGDCVVLESDPDKALSEVNDPQKDSDECLIVGQKGQIACRDYPHPRHDCAKFPFSSTSHEQHCELCHCFVCDSRAPCSYWGLGTSSTDHCHATDKEEKWKTLRKTFRHKRNSPIPVTKAPVTSQSTAMPRFNQATRHDSMQYALQSQVSRVIPTRAGRNFIPQTHIQRPSIISSSSTRYGVPHHPNVGSQRVLNRRTMHPLPVSHHLLGVHNTVIRRDRGIKVSNLGPQFVPSNTVPQSSAYGQPVLQSSLNHDHNCLQNQNQLATNHAFSDSDLNWINNIGQSNQQPSVDYLQLQNSTNEKEASKEVNEGHKSLFNELESFLLDDQSFPEESIIAELNSLSSNHMSYDTGMIFFDIETSWDRLTRA
ncbi:uncharacterized protein LOC120143492 [Hibiscus syriacus]|uniref:uncharacterized protein LOC120143492 n=1 Tax=Hibiscus syriacus TaxID=106335 RepID=UPI00192074CE|nr:uncharacterized protein LOC120143492 [Hibiscus syriacus]